MAMKIYLSGGMRSDWRKKLIEEIVAANPLQETRFLVPMSTFLNQDEWWTYDRALIGEADLVFAYLESGIWCPAGLALEVGYASGLGKPVAFVNERFCSGVKREGESLEEQTARYVKCIESFSNVVFTSLEAGIEYLKKY